MRKPVSFADAARDLVGLMQMALASVANLGQSTFIDFERGRRIVSAELVDAIHAALEAAGLDFIEESGGGPGGRLRRTD